MDHPKLRSRRISGARLVRSHILGPAAAKPRRGVVRATRARTLSEALGVGGIAKALRVYPRLAPAPSFGVVDWKRCRISAVPPRWQLGLPQIGRTIAVFLRRATERAHVTSPPPDPRQMILSLPFVHDAKPVSLSQGRVSQLEVRQREEDREWLNHVAQMRPKTRGECAGIPRPCPFFSCRHHLYLDVHPETGAIKINFPEVKPEQIADLEETCAMDVADRMQSRGAQAEVEDVARIMSLSVERVRQLEAAALQEMRSKDIREQMLVNIRLRAQVKKK